MGATCTGDGGTYYATPGFPYHEASNSQLRLTAGIDDKSHMPSADGELGEMEVDYVKIYQRKLDPGYSSICDSVYKTEVLGPQEICNGDGSSGTLYTATHPSPYGSWGCTPDITIISQSPSQVRVRPTTSTDRRMGAIWYIVNAPGCSYFDAGGKWIQINAAHGANVAVSQTVNAIRNSVKFNITADINGLWPGNASPNDYFTFKWDIMYGVGSFQYNYTAYGKTISTPSLPYIPNTNYPLHYQLTMINRCGSMQQMNSYTYTSPQRPVIRTSDNANHLFVTAIIKDTIAYQRAVNNHLRASMVMEDFDTADIITRIETAEMDALEPFIFDDSLVNIPARFAGPGSVVIDSDSSIIGIQLFPNPAGATLHLTGASLSEVRTDDISIYDLAGRKWKVPVTKNNTTEFILETSGLENGYYILQIKNNAQNKTLSFAIAR